MKPLTIFAVCVLLATAAARADEHRSGLSFSGFGTLGFAHSSERQADFTSNPLRPNGAGYTDRWSPDVDSRLAGQIDARMTESLSAVLQAIAEQRDDGSYKPTIEWANIKYQASPALSVRAGRIALPVLMAAEYRKVGYAIPWVRTPVEVYGLLPITNSDGVDAAYRTTTGGIAHTIKGSFGNTTVRLPNVAERIRAPERVSVRQVTGLSETMTYGPATLRLGYATAVIDADYIQPFFDQFRRFGSAGVAIADRYDVNEKRASIANIGGSYDLERWFAMGEWARIRTKSVLADRTAWYLSTGYRFGDLTPYVMYATVRTDSPTSIAGVPHPAAAPLNAGLNAYLSSVQDQNTVTIGARWDVARNIALKVQYDHLDLQRNAQGTLVNRQPGFKRGGDVHVVSAVVDFVF